MRVWTGCACGVRVWGDLIRTMRIDRFSQVLGRAYKLSMQGVHRTRRN